MSELMAAERRREADMAREQYITRLESDVATLREHLAELTHVYGTFNGVPFDLPGDHPIVAAREALSRISGE